MAEKNDNQLEIKPATETFFVYSEESGEANQYTREEIAWQTYEDQSKE